MTTAVPGWVGMRDSKLGDASPLPACIPTEWAALLTAPRTASSTSDAARGSAPVSCSAAKSFTWNRADVEGALRAVVPPVHVLRRDAADVRPAVHLAEHLVVGVPVVDEADGPGGQCRTECLGERVHTVHLGP